MIASTVKPSVMNFATLFATDRDQFGTLTFGLQLEPPRTASTVTRF